MTRGVAAAALVLLGAAGLILVRGTQDGGGVATDSVEEREGRPTGDGGESAPPDWPTHAGGGFTLRHPPEATAERLDPAVADEPPRVRVRLVGPESEEGTEITDGFTFYARLAWDVGPDSLRARARRIMARRGEGDVVDGPRRTRIAGREAVRFSTRSALGDVVRHAVVEAGGDAAVVVTYVVSGPESRDYERQIRTMIRSLAVTRGAAPAPADPDDGEPTAGGQRTRSVRLAMLDYPAAGDVFTRRSDGERRGCDRVVTVSREIPATGSPLSGALRELFSIDSTRVGGWQNFVARTSGTLRFDSASVRGDTAVVHLSGELSGLRGACDHPRAAVQIEETALQFPSVRAVRIRLDGEPTDLRPGGR